MSTRSNNEKNPRYLFADDAPQSEPKLRIGSPPMLLNWLRNRWPGTTVSARDLYRHGPIRDREIALELAEALVGQGWLAPIKTFRHDRREWVIVGKSGNSGTAT